MSIKSTNGSANFRNKTAIVLCSLRCNSWKILKSIRMIRLSIALVFVLAVTYVFADEDEDSCTEAKDCPCGSVCNEGKCAQGCMLYDTFMAAGAEAKVYGRKCHCGDVPDERGMLLECEEGVAFTGVPKGVAEWENNPSCEKPAPATVATAADVPAADAPAE